MSEPAGKEPTEDPSMEDILASIRRILNDDAPAAEAQGDTKPAGHADGAETDVFLLDQTMLIEEPAPPAPDEPLAAERLAAKPLAAKHSAPEPQSTPAERAPEPMMNEPAAPPQHEPSSDEPLMAASAAAAASASMGALVRVVGQQQTPVYRGGPTLEDMVREEIRPLVKSWLDEHLAPMVERMVRAEIARVSGGQ